MRAIAERRIAVAVTIFLSAVASAANAPQIDDRSLARITAYAGGQARTGTGFLIENGYIVTAYHVVYGTRRVDVEIGGKSYRDVEVFAVRPEADIALLQSEGQSRAAYYRTVEGPQGAAGSQVYVHGLPLGFDKQVLVGHLTQRGYLASRQWTDRQGRSLFVQKDLNLVPLDITSESGVSGAPVLDGTGRVFGVFSGSLQEGGRGYSWAVPLEYARIDEMQRIQRRASAIVEWPRFAYLRTGLTLLRSLNPESEAARIAQRCRARVDEYAAVWEAQVDVAHHALMKIRMMKPALDKAFQEASASPQSRRSRTQLVWQTVQPQFDAFAKAQLKFEGASAQLMTACFSQTVMQPLMPRGLPATRQNEIYDKAWGRRLRQFDEERKNTIGRQRAVIQARGNEGMEKVADVLAEVESTDTAQTANALRNLFALGDKILEQFLSADQAEFIAAMTRMARRWAEMVESMDVHAWETIHRNYYYVGPGGVRLTLTDGWLDFDRELRSAVLAPNGGGIDDYITLINFGTLDSDIPRAFGEVYWHSVSSDLATDASTIESMWATLGLRWNMMQAREGIAFKNVRRRENRVGGDVQLEMSGEGSLRGRPIRDVLTMRFNKRGAAVVNCTLLSDELGYESCTRLIESLQIPRSGY